MAASASVASSETTKKCKQTLRYAIFNCDSTRAAQPGGLYYDVYKPEASEDDGVSAYHGAPFERRWGRIKVSILAGDADIVSLMEILDFQEEVQSFLVSHGYTVFLTPYCLDERSMWYVFAHKPHIRVCDVLCVPFTTSRRFLRDEERATWSKEQKMAFGLGVEYEKSMVLYRLQLGGGDAMRECWIGQIHPGLHGMHRRLVADFVRHYIKVQLSSSVPVWIGGDMNWFDWNVPHFRFDKEMIELFGAEASSVPMSVAKGITSTFYGNPFDNVRYRTDDEKMLERELLERKDYAAVRKLHERINAGPANALPADDVFGTDLMSSSDRLQGGLLDAFLGWNLGESKLLDVEMIHDRMASDHAMMVATIGL